MEIKGSGDIKVADEINVSAINLPGVELGKLIDPTAKGFNKVFNTFFGKRYAQKMRHISLTHAQTQSDIKLIESGKASYNPEDNRLEIKHKSQEIKELIIASFQDDEIINTLKCLMKATEYVSDTDTDNETDGEISQDFINRWREEAKLISNEEFQNIWGRMLAEEIDTPNSISLRTLDAVKNISPSEARIFNDLSCYVAFGEYFLAPQVKNTWLVDTDNLLISKDAGLIDIPGLYMFTNISWADFDLSLKSGNRECYALDTPNFLFIIPKSEATREPMITMWYLTSTGIFLQKIIEHNPDRYNMVLKNLLEIIAESVQEVGTNIVYFYDKSDPEKIIKEHKYL